MDLTFGFGRKSVRRAAARAPLMWLGGVAAGEGPVSYEAQVRAAYLGNAIAQRAVKVVAESVASALPVVTPRGSAAERLLASPGAGRTGAEFVEALASHLLLHGNAYAAGGREGGAPAAMFTLRPERMSVETGGDGWPVAYLYRAGAAATRFAPDEILHLKAFHPLDDHFGLGCLTAGAAKLVAETALDSAGAGRRTRELRLPWRWAATAPGDRLRVDGEDWRIRHWTMEGLALTLALEAEPAMPEAAARPSDPGRIPVQDATPPGPTTLIAVEPPAGMAPPATSPRLWLIAAGASASWRRAELLLSSDGGASFASVGVAGPGAVIGATVNALGDGPADRWDLVNAIDVTLLADTMVLTSCDDAALWAGANLALVGRELVQFGRAEQLGPRRWRLTRLLRGRRGSEAAVAGHRIADSFALISPDTTLAIDLPLSAVGSDLLVKAVGPGEPAASVTAASVAIDGRSLRPLAPAHLRASLSDTGDLAVSWIRRSRGGFDWVDGGESPLAEERETYRVAIGTASPRIIETDAPTVVYGRAERAADGFGSPLRIEVRQIGAGVGPSDALVQQFELPPP